MSNNISIYRHIFPNGKVYIGQTCQKPEYRWSNGKGYKSSPFIFNAINKYGWDNIQHEVLFTGLDQLNADIIEEDLIYYYKQIDKSYNLANGGSVNRGWKQSDEAKEKLRIINTGRTMSDEAKGKISKALRKKVKQIDPESGEVIKIWNSQTEACEFYNGNPGLISDAIKRNSLTKGYYWKFEDDNTPLIKKKNPLNKEVEQIDKKTLEVIKVWDSLSEVERQLNISASNISNVCKGKRKTAGGFIWRMKE